MPSGAIPNLSSVGVSLLWAGVASIYGWYTLIAASSQTQSNRAEPRKRHK